MIYTATAIVGLKITTRAAQHLWQRGKMKERDEEIEQQRETERETERARQRLEWFGTIQHFSHHHPLHKLNVSSTFRCSSCGECGSGRAYTCRVAGCSYWLHEVCSGGPVGLPSSNMAAAAACCSAFNTFAHRLDHQVTEVCSNTEFQCDHCLTDGIGRRYICTSSDRCNVSLHPVCAKHPTRLSSFMHPEHELDLRTKKWFKRCQICHHSLRAGQKALNLRVYGCKKCKFWVHPTCSQLPQYLLHGLHQIADGRMHTLQLKRVESETSRQCGAKCGSSCTAGWQYVCTVCSVSFHIKCILRHSVQDIVMHGRSNKVLFDMIGIFISLAVNASGVILS